MWSDDVLLRLAQVFPLMFEEYFQICDTSQPVKSFPKLFGKFSPSLLLSIILLLMTGFLFEHR